VSDALQNIKNWFGQPFSPEMSGTGWFLFFGLLIIISALWAIILRHIRIATTEI
jgi:hypothetical protein